MPSRLLLALASLALMARANGTMAANFTVNSTADAVDARPGDGACATLAGQCTLRAAIQEANARPGADSIKRTARHVRSRHPGSG